MHNIVNAARPDQIPSSKTAGSARSTDTSARRYPTQPHEHRANQGRRLHSVQTTQNPHAEAERALGTAGVARRAVTSAESVAASGAWWDADADAYHQEHGDFLGVSDFVWCPRSLREEAARLLGDVTGKDILEVGCGSAPCARWLADQGARAVAFDLSAGM